MLTRLEYHRRRLNQAMASVMQLYYDMYGDEDSWDKWVYEEENACLRSTRQRINLEDGFPLDFA